MSRNDEIQTSYLIIHSESEGRLHSRKHAMELLQRKKDERARRNGPMGKWAIARVSWVWGKVDP